MSFKTGKQQAPLKAKTAGIDYPFSSALVGGFCSEMMKVANLLPPPDNALGQIKSTTPKLTMGAKKSITPYSQPKTNPATSPAQGVQPTLGAPTVKA